MRLPDRPTIAIVGATGAVGRELLALLDERRFAYGGLRSRSLLRVGLLMAAGSNIAWIAARKTTELVRGAELPVEWRYDNDIYHFLLIASTLVIYRSFKLSPENSTRSA